MCIGNAKFVRLETILNLSEPIFAHRNESKEKELLIEHTNLCEKYLIKLVQQKKLEQIFENIENALELNLSERGRELFYQMLVSVITFHDTGKINPNFQYEKMKNENAKKYISHKGYGTQHSIYSATIYLDYFCNYIQNANIEQEEKNIFLGFCAINAYVISRHHGNLICMDSFLSEFVSGGKIESIFLDMKEDNFKKFYQGPYYPQNIKIVTNKYKKYVKNLSNEQGIVIFIYSKLSYSILITCDYYATNEYSNEFEMKSFGDYDEKEQLRLAYENSKLIKSIRLYEKNRTVRDITKDIAQELELNNLRNEIFLDVENELNKNQEGNIFFLEAPTGSGKSNIAMNFSFTLLKESMNKIIYVYPFNTLVEQNMDSLRDILGENKEIMSKISIINSVTPIEIEKNKDTDEDNQEVYQKALLDRQFSNYPFVLTTHISLFQTMFGNEKESVFDFLQLTGSIIVFDEIQSYRNSIWTEIITFLSEFASVLNIKILIMSATLPNLELLMPNHKNIIRLTKDTMKYFKHPLFKNRVKVSYELLENKADMDMLINHVVEMSRLKRKIMIEFIKKGSAYKFYDALVNKEKIMCQIERITGDDNQIDREAVLKKVKTCSEIIVVATQVVEAGVDIDMDIGYKDISKLDSEEQFLGRINRNCKRSGIVYFFDIDNATKIYKDDYRIDAEYTLQNEKMKEILEEKNFDQYYKAVLENLKSQLNGLTNEKGLEYFWEENIKKLDYPGICEHMKLIEDNTWNMSVFLTRVIEKEDGERIDAEEVWEKYKQLLMDSNMEYAEKQIKLFNVRSKMNYFIYEIPKNSIGTYNDKIGELYKIDNGEDFFENGKLNKTRLVQMGDLFL